MTTHKTTDPTSPQTLGQAHEALAHIRPDRQAPLTEWLSYHQRATTVYGEIAEIDRGHHHESLAYAYHERKLAKETQEQINSSGVRPEGGEHGK